MESLGKLQLPFHHPRKSFSSPFSFRSSSQSTSFFKCDSIRASSSKSQHPKLPFLQSLPYRLLKSTCITFTTAATLFFINLQLKSPLANASPFSATPFMEFLSQRNGDVSLKEERSLEEHLASNPEDVKALRSLLEVKINSQNLLEALKIIERLIYLKPDEKEWPILKSNIFSYKGDSESAIIGFEEILVTDPLCVDAYQGLLMAYPDLNAMERRIKEAIKKCNKKKKNFKKLRDFKILLAQIRVIEGKLDEALKMYEELAIEEPGDFRPYLGQGIVYIMLEKQDESDKEFEKFNNLCGEIIVKENMLWMIWLGRSSLMRRDSHTWLDDKIKWALLIVYVTQWDLEANSDC